MWCNFIFKSLKVDTILTRGFEYFLLLCSNFYIFTIRCIICELDNTAPGELTQPATQVGKINS